MFQPYLTPSDWISQVYTVKLTSVTTSKPYENSTVSRMSWPVNVTILMKRLTDQAENYL